MSTTISYSFELPTIFGDVDSWGEDLNNNWTMVDALLGGRMPIVNADLNNPDIDGGTINGVTLGANTVSSSSIADRAVTSDKLAHPSVLANAIASNAVTSAKIAENAINSSHLGRNSVGSSEIATNAVGSSEIADGAVTQSKISANAITSDKIAANAIGSSEIAANAVGSSEIAANAVGSSEIADGAVTQDKLAVPLSSIPAGSIVAWPTETPPSGWLECAGQTVLRTTYPALFTAIGTRYGNTSSTNFRVPDLRGEFIRGWAHGDNADPDRASRSNRGDGTTGDNVGTRQSDELQSHSHDYAITNNSEFSGGGVSTGQTGQNTLTTNATGGSETRPRNVAMMYIIKT